VLGKMEMQVTLLAAVPALADVALLILRLTVGLMFALSGYFKLTVPERRQKMEASLKSGGMSPGLAPLVSAGELIGGIGVTVGLLTVPAALVLLIISLVAGISVVWPKAEGQSIHKIENVLYSPEALIAVTMLVLLAIGAGSISLDAMLFR